MRRCRVEYRPRFKWASLLNATMERQWRVAHEYVMVLLDDVVLRRGAFDASALLDLARRHRLDRVSPLVRGASWDIMRPSAEDARRAANGTELRLTNFLESYATLFTAAAWRCYSSMFADDILHNATDAIGYGYDHCFKAHCGAREASGIQQAVALEQMAEHDDVYASAAHGCCAPTTGANPNATADVAPAGRRLALGSTYNLATVGHEQMRLLQRWVWRTDRRRCSHVAPQQRESVFWSAYVEPRRSMAVAQG
jgi:hypothetical protein